jgi:hypothetical protein
MDPVVRILHSNPGMTGAADMGRALVARGWRPGWPPRIPPDRRGPFRFPSFRFRSYANTRPA